MQAICADLGDWFTGGDSEVNEEIVGLGDYGRTLTALWADALSDSAESEDDILLPSERFYRRTRCSPLQRATILIAP